MVPLSLALSSSFFVSGFAGFAGRAPLSGRIRLHAAAVAAEDDARNEALLQPGEPAPSPLMRRGSRADAIVAVGAFVCFRG